MNLTKIQKNKIFTVINQHSLNPNDFKFLRSHNVIKFIHLPTKYFINFLSGNTSNYKIEYSPGKDMHTETKLKDKWDEIIEIIAQWAYLLQQEIEEPDLWSSYIKINTKLRIKEEDNLPFSVKEHNLLIDKINLLENRIVKELDLSKKQTTDIKSLLNNLKEKSESLGKKDFYIFLLGTLQGIAMNFAFDAPKIEKLLKIVKEIFSSVLQLVSG